MQLVYFTLTHSKQEELPHKEMLDDLVYVHCNLHLKLKCIEEEMVLKYDDPLYSDFVYDREDLMIGWHEGQ